MSLTEVSSLNILGDARGSLIALESNRDIPFEIKRVFYIFGTKLGVSRGNHSHYITQQYLIAVHGKCKVTLEDGKGKRTYDLNSPNQGLLQSSLVWGSMHDFSPDCVLMVLADQPYDDSDYIRDYDEFKKLVSRNNVLLVPYDRGFLGLSWTWLNDTEIKALTMTPDFTKEKQEIFYDSLVNRPNYLIYGVTCLGERIGACGLKVEKNIEAELWLYIGVKEFWGKGLGSQVVSELEKKACKIGVQRLILKVSKKNLRAQALYKKLSYAVYMEQEDVLWMKKELTVES